MRQKPENPGVNICSLFAAFFGNFQSFLARRRHNHQHEGSRWLDVCPWDAGSLLARRCDDDHIDVGEGSRHGFRVVTAGG
jgi:hypothetical protein